jgi:hypothetical protein
MFRTTNRIRLRVDLALTGVEGLASVTPARQELLVPGAPLLGTDRLRPTPIAPVTDSPARFGTPEPFDS